MKVLLSAITYHPTVGGADDFVRSIAEGLAARGHDVRVVASDLLRHVAGVKLSDTTEKTLNGVRIIRCPSWNIPGRIYPIWPGFFREVLRFRPDVIHGFGLGYFSADAPALMRRHFPTVISPTGGRFRSNLFGVASVSRWTALSESERRSLREIMRGRASILSPSVDPSEWETIRPDPFPQIPRGRRVIFAGRLAKDKGLPDLLATNARCDFVIVGPDYGFGPIAPRPNVHVIGELDRERLIAAYQHCDVVVLPSYHEGFGIVLLEAMAAGKPAIAYDNTSMPELTSLLVKTGDIAGLSSMIESVLDDPKDYSARGQERAFREFSRTGMIDRVLALYRETLANF